MSADKQPTNGPDVRFGMGIHTHHIVLALLLFGITALFLSCTVAYVYTRVEHGAPSLGLPPVFLFNTLLLIGGSLALRRASRAFDEDQPSTYKQALLLTLGLTVLFLAAQLFGWKQLIDQQIAINRDNSASYLYLISALHFVHVIGGLPFLVTFYLKAHKRVAEPVGALVYFSEPSRKLRLRLITWYWHFLDIVWIYLVLFFYINSLIG